MSVRPEALGVVLVCFQPHFTGGEPEAEGNDVLEYTWEVNGRNWT